MNDFTLASLLKILQKCIWHMLVVAIVFGVAAYAFCTFMATPTYQASVSFVATNKGFGDETMLMQENTTSKISSADVAASLALLNTYIDILCIPEMYEELEKEVDLNYTARELASMVEISPRSDDSLLLDVVVTSTNPVHSVEIANAFLKLGDDYVMKCIPNAYLKGVQHSSGAVQNYPNPPLTIVVLMLFGAALVYGIAVLIHAMDNTIKGESDFTSNYDIPLLGNIPNFKTAIREERYQ